MGEKGSVQWREGFACGKLNSPRAWVAAAPQMEDALSVGCGQARLSLREAPGSGRGACRGRPGSMARPVVPLEAGMSRTVSLLRQTAAWPQPPSVCGLHGNLRGLSLRSPCPHPCWGCGRRHRALVLEPPLPPSHWTAGRTVHCSAVQPFPCAGSLRLAGSSL